LQGDLPPVEGFLAEHPELQTDERFVELICNEIALREAGGEAPSWQAYQQRFRQFASQLRRRFRPPEPPSGDETLPLARPPAPRDGPAEERIPGYEILSELGRGTMGVVYRARHLKLNRVVALKMILSGAHADAEELTRFRAEAEAVAQLKHPNIVQVYDVGEHNGKPFFSLEFVEGGPLTRQLARRALKPRQAAELLETLARAMHSAHLQNIIHRDLKPANILLTPEGAPKIADFGLAKRLEDDSGQTQSGSIMGSPSYMAPEQADGRLQDLGPATDVYALGAILYETITGRVPFKGATILDTLALVRGEEPIAPSRLQPGVPRDLETICLKCLQKEPAKRYESAADLADDLRRFLDGEPILARPMGRAERLWRWCRRNPAAASLLLTLTLGSAFGLWYLSRLSRSLVRAAALEGAAQQAETLDNLNDFYSDRVVHPAAAGGVPATPFYRTQPRTIPIPATFTIDLGDYISEQSQGGSQVRLYSDLPFPFREGGGVRDDFEREALERLRENPDEPAYRFEELGGRPVLRYATARRMKESCVACHNTHPDSPKTDWKVGDVRGVLEIIRPLDNDEERTGQGLRGTFVLVGGLSAALLAACSLVFVLGNRRRRARLRGG
jgi:tRNA A-37 threonylcarbamoyl transferase component Bud32